MFGVSIYFPIGIPLRRIAPADWPLPPKLGWRCGAGCAAPDGLFLSVLKSRLLRMEAYVFGVPQFSSF